MYNRECRPHYKYIPLLVVFTLLYVGCSSMYTTILVENEDYTVALERSIYMYTDVDPYPPIAEAPKKYSTSSFHSIIDDIFENEPLSIDISTDIYNAFQQVDEGFPYVYLEINDSETDLDELYFTSYSMNGDEVIRILQYSKISTSKQVVRSFLGSSSITKSDIESNSILYDVNGNKINN